MVKNILSISGGGIRGVAVAEFLRNLEKDLNVSIYDKFDMFAGTSTGSLVVSSIVYGKMSGEQLINELYTLENSKQIMNKSCFDKILDTVQFKPKYTNNGIKNVIEKYIPKSNINDTPKDVIITAFDIDKFKPVVFKSFTEKQNVSIKNAMCMSSAAPAYFPTFYDTQEDLWCIDGGIYANCPVEVAYAEALKIYGKDEDIRVLSIGTGYNHNIGLGKQSQNYGGIEWVTEGDLINLAFKAPQVAVNYKMKVFTEALEHKYIHIDGQMRNTVMDDTSEKNIKQLKQYGKEWYVKYGKEVIKMLNE